MPPRRRSQPPAEQPSRPAEFVQPAPVLPPATTLLCAVCGGHYIDTDPGRRAHVVVLGHPPRQREKDGG